MRFVKPLARTFVILLAGLTAPAFAQAPATKDVTPLVTAEWLNANANSDNLVILDIRDKVDEVDLGDLPYIANAVAAPYASAGWRVAVDGIPGQLPPLEEIVALIGNLGIDADDHVVIVPWGTDSSEFGGATRVYWTFKYLGHDAVSILDGGWRQYDAAGGERVKTPRTAEPVKFTYELREELRATTDDVVAALASGVKLIDGRPQEQYLGKSKSPIVATAGTLPGAVNIEHSSLYSAEYASFAQPETIAALAAAVGLGENEKNIAFCNTGHWASIAWFGLSEVLGNKNTTMYDGSMAEWTADASRPVETH